MMGLGREDGMNRISEEKEKQRRNTSRGLLWGR